MKNVLIALFAGIAIGVLLTSDKGSNAWKKIEGGLDDLKDNLASGAKDLLRSGKDMMGDAKSKVEKVTG